MGIKVLVDFVVLTLNGVVPDASPNVYKQDGIDGFFPMCKDKCPLRHEQEGDTSFPRLQFCDCVAELLVADLNTDFAAVSDIAWELGEMRTAECPPFDHGHELLQQLFETPPPEAQRKPLRLTVWIAGHLAAGTGYHLDGSTYLDQRLYTGEGAGVLLAAGVSRAGRRLSHETGHVVGFHHTAGPPVDYTYTGCGESLIWPMLLRPTCEINIMGAWYDGPFCCPSGSLLQRLRGVRRAANATSAAAVCKPRDPDVFGEQAYCCGDLCTHKCGPEKPAMTFATPEHEQVLRTLAACWAAAFDTPKPAKLSLLARYTEDLADAHAYMEDASRIAHVRRASR